MTFEDCLRRQRSRTAMRSMAEDIRRAVRSCERRRKRMKHTVAAAGLVLALGACTAFPPAIAAGSSPALDKPARACPTVEAPAEPSPIVMHTIQNCTVTHYDACVLCCGKSDGITASGPLVEPYVTCAVDPAVIPLGAEVLLDYGDGVLHAYRAEDTGVTGAAVDLYVSGHQEALALGVKTATAYWMEKVEEDG